MCVGWKLTCERFIIYVFARFLEIENQYLNLRDLKEKEKKSYKQMLFKKK